MTRQNIDFQAVERAFNEIKVMRGQYTSIATADGDGTPNVAPIGSMRIVDETTLHVLEGRLPKTLANLRKNPKAAFSVCLRPSLLSRLSMPRGREILGYRVYGTLTGESDIKADVATEVEMILHRMPLLARGMFRKFCDRNMHRVLTFEIAHIRAIGLKE